MSITWPFIRQLQHFLLVLSLAICFGGFFSSASAATVPVNPSNFLSLVGNAKPGDKFILAPGNYGNFQGCPAGTSSGWITIQGQTGVKFSRMAFYGAQFSYVILDSILVDGDQCIFGQGAHHLILQNSEVRNINQAGGLEMYGVNDCAALNNYIHHVGTRANYDHGIYMYGLRNRIEGNRIEDVAAYGIHNYSGGKTNGQNSIRRNTVRRNGRVSPTQTIAGIVSTSGDGTVIEQNTVDTCIGGIHSGSGVTNIKINNNTILNITGAWLALDAAGSGAAQNNKVDPGKVLIRSSAIQASNNNLTASGAGGSTTPTSPPATNVTVAQSSQTQPQPSQQAAGANLGTIAAFVVGGVVLASLMKD